MLELIVQKCIVSANQEFTRPGDIFRRFMECVASGLFLPGLFVFLSLLISSLLLSLQAIQVFMILVRRGQLIQRATCLLNKEQI